MFEECSSLESIDLSNFSKINNLINYENMFKGCDNLKNTNNIFFNNILAKTKKDKNLK